MRYFLRKIKWAYQRVTRGYDDTVYWGFDGYFLQILPALDSFCKNYLKNIERSELNPERASIFKETIRLIEQYNLSINNWNYKEKSELFSYIGKNIGWYWD